MAYKYDGNHSCVYVDGAGYTGCPSQFWANPLDSLCTAKCPYGYFADQTVATEKRQVFEGGVLKSYYYEGAEKGTSFQASFTSSH